MLIKKSGVLINCKLPIFRWLYRGVKKTAVMWIGPTITSVTVGYTGTLPDRTRDLKAKSQWTQKVHLQLIKKLKW